MSNIPKSYCGSVEPVSRDRIEAIRRIIAVRFSVEESWTAETAPAYQALHKTDTLIMRDLLMVFDDAFCALMAMTRVAEMMTPSFGEIGKACQEGEEAFKLSSDRNAAPDDDCPYDEMSPSGLSYVAGWWRAAYSRAATRLAVHYQDTRP